MQSIKRNFSYNLILTLCGYIFPLITFPYVSRVLGVENIGICNFVDSIIDYFILFAQLGIGSYGVREIARCREERDRRNEVFNNLFFIYVLTTFISGTLLVVLTFSLPLLQPYKPFLLLGLLKLLFTLFLIQWLFQGIEDFKFITVRSVIVRCLYVIGIFVFVHTREDTLVYYSLTTITIALNAIINWHYSRKYVTLSLKKINPRLYIIPILAFGYYRILTSMYTTFNVTFLGFTTNDTEVGYFTTATKLYTIILSVFTAFTTVMVPRVSYMLEQGQKKELQAMVDKVTSLLASLVTPIIIFCLFQSKSIIYLIAGPGYEGSIIPFQIVIFLLFIIGLEQVIIQQFLMASSSNKSIFIVSSIGAVVGISVNILLTPHFGAIGSSIAWGVSESAVLLTGIYILKKQVGITLDCLAMMQNMSWALLYMLSIGVIRIFDFAEWLDIILSAIIVVVAFVLINMKTHQNEFLVNAIKRRRHE